MNPLLLPKLALILATLSFSVNSVASPQKDFGTTSEAHRDVGSSPFRLARFPLSRLARPRSIPDAPRIPTPDLPFGRFDRSISTPPLPGLVRATSRAARRINQSASLPPQFGQDQTTPADWHGILELSDRDSLTVSEAQALSAFKGGILILDGLSSLPSDVAHALACFEGLLSFNGLTSLTEESALALSSHRGVLFLDGLTSLSPTVARQLAAHDGTLSLCGITDLTPQTAKALAAVKGTLFLDELGAPTVTSETNALITEVAAALSNHKGDLSLNGLRTLTPDAASALANHQGRLRLGELSELPLECTEALARHQGPLCVAKVTCLSPSLVEKFLAQGNLPDISAVTSLTPETAAALAKYHGQLNMPLIRGLDAETATALVAHQGGLSLPGLSEVSEPVANILAGYPGFLTLGAMKTLPPSLVRHYVQKEGLGLLPDLTRVDVLSAASATELAAHPGPLILPAITSLPLDTAKALAPHAHALTLPAIISVSSELAKVLSSHRGDLSLPSLAEITPQTAEAFSRHSGELVLSGVHHLSAEAAVLLARHAGPVVLTGLVDMDNATEDALRANPLCRVPFNTRRWLTRIGIATAAITSLLAISYLSAPRVYRELVISTGRPIWWIPACGFNRICRACWHRARSVIREAWAYRTPKASQPPKPNLS